MKIRIRAAVIQTVAWGLLAAAFVAVCFGSPFGAVAFASVPLFLWGDRLAAWLSNPSVPNRVSRRRRRPVEVPADIDWEALARTRPVVLSPGERAWKSARTRYFNADPADPSATLGFLIASEEAVERILAEARGEAPAAGLYSQALYQKLTARRVSGDLSSHPTRPTGLPLGSPEDEPQGVESAPYGRYQTDRTMSQDEFERLRANVEAEIRQAYKTSRLILEDQ